MAQQTVPQGGARPSRCLPLDLFTFMRAERTVAPEPAAGVIITIERLSGSWWALHRSDGLMGALFDDREAAMRQAERESRLLDGASILVVDQARRDGRPTF